jgi:cell division septation protein DedD
MLEHKYAETIRANRLLLGVSFTALVMLGPAFTLGYISGYRSARASGPPTASGPALVASLETELRKPAARSRTQKPLSAERADQPAVGQVYLQLVTTAESRSAGIIDVLRNKGFPAVAMDVPEKSGLRRVLIGPLREGELDKTRADLQSKGFPGDSAIKRTF